MERCWDVLYEGRYPVMETAVGYLNVMSLTLNLDEELVYYLGRACPNQTHPRSGVDGCWFALLAHDENDLCGTDVKVDSPHVS